MQDILSTPHDDEIDLFAEIIQAEAAITEATNALKEASRPHQSTIAQQNKLLEELWQKMTDHMKSTGQLSMVLPGDVTDYKIAFKAGSERVVVADPEAVPDEFCKVERKPMLTEIKKHIADLPEGETVNWATVERGPESIGWKAIKKGKGDVEA